MSRHTRFPKASSLAVRVAGPALLAALLSLPCPAPAGVIRVDVGTYRLDDGPAVEGAWEIAEKLAVSKEAAIVVMEKSSTMTMVQNMLQLLETLKVPTVFTKRADYDVLVDRGVLRPDKAKP